MPPLLLTYFCTKILNRKSSCALLHSHPYLLKGFWITKMNIKTCVIRVWIFKGFFFHSNLLSKAEGCMLSCNRKHKERLKRNTLYFLHNMYMNFFLDPKLFFLINQPPSNDNSNLNFHTFHRMHIMNWIGELCIVCRYVI